MTPAPLVATYDRRGRWPALASLNTVSIPACELAAKLRGEFQSTETLGSIATAALAARVEALGRWQAEHDPQRQSNQEAMVEAAARFPMTERAGGPEFEPAAFQEMILFIEELPW
jgi:hypothetical protein